MDPVVVERAVRLGDPEIAPTSPMPRIPVVQLAPRGRRLTPFGDPVSDAEPARPPAATSRSFTASIRRAARSHSTIAAAYSPAANGWETSTASSSWWISRTRATAGWSASGSRVVHPRC
jgi:hypothetical protein